MSLLDEHPVLCAVVFIALLSCTISGLVTSIRREFSCRDAVIAAEDISLLGHECESSKQTALFEHQDGKLFVRCACPRDGGAK